MRRQRAKLMSLTHSYEKDWKRTTWGSEAMRLVQESETERLTNCGLVYHIRQRDQFCWVGPPERRLDGEPIVRVLPLVQAQPTPNLEIRAHGEIYLLPYNFKGTWFDVESSKGVRLIP